MASPSTPRDHINEIRKKKFWIGVGENPLSKTVLMSVKYLSAELYSKDVHFLMELIQNAEDNEYPEGTEPSLEFIITDQDITNTGAPATLLVFNNEKGFSPKNMESICDVGDSTKAGNRKRGYIGEKGIGFKSVFLLTAYPYIFSNGYQIRFSETPCPECKIAYIVPEWVDSKPALSDLKKIYGQNRGLPTTTIILPLKPDKVKAVKAQLSNLHPELLLFLSKIKQLSVKEDNIDPSLNTVRSISISSETEFASKKNIDAESYTIHLTVEEDGDTEEGQCCYYMWRQRFPVKNENKVEKRMDMEEWAITLAFPFGKRLDRGMSSPGIYAFLPTETVTNLPFIIQADFLLPSSRETILWDNAWNQGILNCVPTTFINAFVALVRAKEDSPPSSLAAMFAFLPVNSSSHSKLNVIRESIKGKLLQENIIPSESPAMQMFFHKPGEVRRLMPSFWDILHKAKSQGLKLHNLPFEGRHILHSSFDIAKYDKELSFLGIELVDYEWYPKCIQRCNLVLNLVEDVYKELLYFVAVNWESKFDKTIMRSIPLLKYVEAASGNVSLFSVKEAMYQSTLSRSRNPQHISWLIDWSREFRAAGKPLFLPKRTQELCSRVVEIETWLRDCVKVQTLSIYGYASLFLNSLENNRALVLAFAHFLYLSHLKGFFSETEVKHLCREMPLLNANGGVSVRPRGVLVPANGSKWAELIGSNPWGKESYVELAEEYLNSGRYAGQFVQNMELINFLKSYAGASDVPDVCPPNADFPTVSGPLTKQNVFLLLEWIRAVRTKRAELGRFFNCIMNGSWLKVTMSGCPGYKPPSQSFLSNSSWGSLLQSGSEMVDIPLVDQGFYGLRIRRYEVELKAIGIMTECGQACQFIGKHLMSLAKNYNLTRSKVLAMLQFVKFLREKFLPVDEFVKSIQNVEWVKTSCGDRSPVKSVLKDQGWEAASAISLIPFIDQAYYGEDILSYKTELSLLGVMVGFMENYQIVVDYLKPSRSLEFLMAEPLIFALKCIRFSRSSDKLVASLKAAKCLQTNFGYLCPDLCFLFDHEWGCILEVFDDFPRLDGDFYGKEIFQYRDELRRIGVVVDFDVASKAFFDKFRQRASSKRFTKENVLSFLASYRKLREKLHALPAEVRACIHQTKWLRSRLGDNRAPGDCILFSADWDPISHITLLPFIDDSDDCYGPGIHGYRDELKRMGVKVDLEKGAHFVLSNIFFPQDNTGISPASVISLLQCIRYLKTGGKQISLPKKISKAKWLKTMFGYMLPGNSLLFDPKQRSPLQRQDGPFIDEEHYGQCISSYKDELAEIGVTVDMSGSDATSLLAKHIKFLSDSGNIERVYEFLSEFNWKLGEGVHGMIWIPASFDEGMWVSPQECVLYDDNNLFRSRLHVLDQKYKSSKILPFFSKAFRVRTQPSTGDYCKLWKDWENSSSVITHAECCAFWRHVISHWSHKKEEMISECVAKIPAVSSNSGDIQLLNKQDVFIPDDLLLKDLFEKSSPNPLFVWCPMRNLPAIPRATLFDIYSKIGVRPISRSVTISEFSTPEHEEPTQVNLKGGYIVKGLVMLILGFLSDLTLNIDVKHRHEAVKKLLKVTVFEEPQPVIINYSLKMSSGDVVEVPTSRMVRWEKESSAFFTQKLDRLVGKKNIVEYATHFAQVVSEGLLWEKEDLIPKLSELIKVGFLMDFDEEAVAYFMKSKKLQIFEEDAEFLTSAFPSC